MTVPDYISPFFVSVLSVRLFSGLYLVLIMIIVSVPDIVYHFLCQYLTIVHHPYVRTWLHFTDFMPVPDYCSPSLCQYLTTFHHFLSTWLHFTIFCQYLTIVHHPYARTWLHFTDFMPVPDYCSPSLCQYLTTFHHFVSVPDYNMNSQYPVQFLLSLYFAPVCNLLTIIIERWILVQDCMRMSFARAYYIQMLYVDMNSLFRYGGISTTEL